MYECDDVTHMKQQNQEKAIILSSIVVPHVHCANKVR